jgi:predicted NBD/HSP70 family sugar kinase
MATKPIGSRSEGITSDEVRRHNLALILDRVHRAGSMSRAALTSSTGLNRSTVGALVAELTELGFVDEGAPEIEGPGRPSPMVVPIPGSAVVLACAINVYSVEVATVGLCGQVFERIVEPSPVGGQSPAEVARRVADMARRVLAAVPTGSRVVGAGVSVTAIVRPDGLVLLAPNLGWRDVELGAELEASLGMPVTLVNDADAGAFAEHVRGAAVDHSDIVYVSGEVGIGTGVISGGVPFRGVSGYAGEAGHMVVNVDGRQCRCGAHGCWETEAGEEALLGATGTAVEVDGLTALADLERRAREGEARAIDGIAAVGRWLGIGLGDLINLFNPELVLLGGFFNRFFPWLEAAAREAISERALAAPLAATTILPSGLGADAPLLGAAEIALIPVIADPAAMTG